VKVNKGWVDGCSSVRLNVNQVSPVDDFPLHAMRGAQEQGQSETETEREFKNRHLTKGVDVVVEVSWKRSVESLFHVGNQMTTGDI